MKNIQIDTVEQALALLEAAVRYKGADHVEPQYERDYGGDGDGTVTDIVTETYGTCRYVGPGGKPGCIIGTALILAGVDKDVLASREGQAVDSLIQSGVIVAGKGVRAVLTMAQTIQDSRRPWSEALRVAKDRAIGLHSV